MNKKNILKVLIDEKNVKFFKIQMVLKTIEKLDFIRELLLNSKPNSLHVLEEKYAKINEQYDATKLKLSTLKIKIALNYF